MLARIKNNGRNYDIRNPLARYRRANSIGCSRHFQNPAIHRPAYVSRSDWALHRPRRMGRWGIHSLALRFNFLPSWNRSARGAYGKFGRVWPRDGIKNLAWCEEMKQFLIEQIPVLFFIAMFFLMLALGG